jgi:hypothetical protein
MKNALAAVLAATSLATISAASALAADKIIYEEQDHHGGIRIGILACDVGEGGGYLLGSAKELNCVFRSNHRSDDYTGYIKKLGVDLGYTSQGRIVWAVFAPTAGYHRGSLGGIYVGASAEATLGAGVGANVLLGGTRGSIQLQPLSISGQIGLNVAAASTTVTLKPAD